MGQLKSLEDEYPIIDSIFQQFCASHGIFTVEDFLIYDLNALMSFSGKQPNSEKLKQGIDQVLSIVDGCHRPWLNGVELLKDVQQNKQTLSLAYDGIDPLLNGVLREGFVTELVGPSSSGKTQVCLQAAASVAKGCGGRVVFIDSGNSFSAPRIAQLLDQASYSSSKQDKDESLHSLMKNIWCYPVFDIFSLFDVLHQVELKLKSQMCSVQLLIVDSFSSLIIPLLGGSGPYDFKDVAFYDSGELVFESKWFTLILDASLPTLQKIGHALMISAGSLLKKIAHEHSLSVLVTNHMVAGEGGSAKPALGESWKSVPHMRLLLSRDRECNSCIISAIRHPSMAAGTQMKFRICDG